ncbi:3-deoxy-7-phosphoheptulonate synthase [Dietzia cinnamea]|uniref:3-deoxy-7-phosphoheptulonate synthase n=1 Tax=Dietzia cinnamea TaxID=321318 RepID=UPI0021A71F85|nr:3-deoxy-7-phosphoheptulonate synthase [Dietzia cinnamea]MCT1640503.1 3-deoxy-7-phosphoheptulonate synthase [Dietzia cinnamea]
MGTEEDHGTRPATTDSSGATAVTITAENPTQTADRRVLSYSPLPTPTEILGELPLGEAREALVERSRSEIADVLAGRDDRLLVVVGPCSVHDTEAALDYAGRLAELAAETSEDLLIVMRVYFEKPRTTVGWKGLINDPALDGTYDIPRGLRTARKLLLDVLDLGLPVGTEFLEPTSPQYIADAVSWGAIGARTTESQVHRQLVSGLSMPVGFKNGTDGEVQVAVDGCRSSAAGHVFFGTDADGRAAVVETAGNTDCHVILRGGTRGPNHDAESVAAAVAAVGKVGLPGLVMVDASHANSGKSHERQAEVVAELAERIGGGEQGISGLMIESFIEPGAQSVEAEELVYGQSVTDACMGWDTTAEGLRALAAAVRAGRRD